MTITFALMRYFAAAFVVGLGVGVVLQVLVRLIRNVTNSVD